MEGTIGYGFAIHPPCKKTKNNMAKCKLISVDAIKDFMAYKKIRVTYPNGEEKIIKRPDTVFAKNIFQALDIHAANAIKNHWKRLNELYPDCIVRAIYKEEDKPKFVRRRNYESIY